VPIQKRHLAPDFGVGRRIRILEIFHICLRFESTARLELGRKLPFLDGHEFSFRNGILHPISALGGEFESSKYSISGWTPDKKGQLPDGQPAENYLSDKTAIFCAWDGKSSTWWELPWFCCPCYTCDGSPHSFRAWHCRYRPIFLPWTGLWPPCL
jgi:hypothetical protein